ncbi:MAG: GNAT family N-acetyltransferase, partial [Gemmatimonadota bacterium]|nr:GNAT family N-acetyltransferase [Gemmatimonadota bacterium]
RDEDLPTAHALHNDVFPPVPLEEMRRWMSRADVTAGVAVRDGEVVGEIPLHVRRFVIRPGVTARLAFEHSVCVREDMRGQGVGSAIQQEIRRFIASRADVLGVYRGAERSPAYNYYRDNGLADCCYVREWILDDPARVAYDPPELSDASAVLDRAEQFAAVFDDAYAHAGGYEQRLPGFYETAFTQLEATELRTRYHALVAEGAAGPRGHCILGLSPDGTLQIMELATRGRCPATADRLLREACAVAADAGGAVRAMLHDGGVYRPVFEALGFIPQPRGEMIMADPLDPERLANLTWAPQAELADVLVRVWTPEEEAVVHRPGGEPTREMTLEMKHGEAVRWLMSRLDLRGAVRSETVTCRGVRPGDVEALSRAIPFTPWEYQVIDHI